MADENKTHTQGEVALLVAVAEVRTMQKMLGDAFYKHAEKDEEQFTLFHEDNKNIITKIEAVPSKMVECAEKIKTDVLNVSRREFTRDTDFQVFVTKVTYIIVGATIAGTVLGVVLNWLVQGAKMAGAQ